MGYISSVSHDEPATSVGFIGLGDMGGPMARNLIAAGHPNTLWTRRV